jgi:hypothetical protein
MENKLCSHDSLPSRFRSLAENSFLPSDFKPINAESSRTFKISVFDSFWTLSPPKESKHNQTPYGDSCCGTCQQCLDFIHFFRLAFSLQMAAAIITGLVTVEVVYNHVRDLLGSLFGHGKEYYLGKNGAKIFNSCGIATTGFHKQGSGYNAPDAAHRSGLCGTIKDDKRVYMCSACRPTFFRE